MPQNLPAYDLDASDLSLRTAYDTCLWLESFSAWGTFATDIEHERSHAIMVETDFPTVAARVLGYGLRFAHSQAGPSALIQEINECNRDLELLAGLAHLYVFGLIQVFRNPKGPTPDISPSQSPKPSSQLAAQDAEHLLRKTSLTAKELRKLTLLRENNCCVFTGARDRASIDINMLQADPAMSRMEMVHIISQYSSEAIGRVTPAARAKFDWARTADAVIERFGGLSNRALLDDQGLNSPLNAFMTTSDPHIAFDQLDMWLTPAKTSNGDLMANTYDVLASDPEVIPAPHPELIAVHAACARVAHMSGAAEYLEELCRETDAISVMTEPNAANELAQSLKALQLHCR
ncbi:hypothetical protein EWM64_g5610 [Hericium alpestre]|uniref:HNH nuclease domain-containing protein n=1 Tax=Hericium alpestre TaxID=135208 RepID=A0A4Y9ZWH7_9AGAM|nr:hypothetical protein EWM64_g5610 [Hericium alpestre]